MSRRHPALGRAGTFIVTLAMSATAACSSGGATTQSVSAPGNLTAFIGVMQNASYDYDAAETPADLAKRSDLVVEGVIVAARTGESYSAVKDDLEQGDVSSVLEVSVDQILAGDEQLVSGGSVYIRVTSPAYVGDGSGSGEGGAALVPFDSEAFNASVPLGLSGVFLLTEVTSLPPFEFVVNEGAGRPAGVPLFGTSPQGFILEGADGSLIGVKESLDSMPQAWGKLDSISELLAEFEEA